MSLWKSVKKAVKKVGKTVGKVLNSHADLVTGGQFSKLTKASSYFDGYQDKLLAGELATVGAALGMSALGGAGALFGSGAGAAAVGTPEAAAGTSGISGILGSLAGSALGAGAGGQSFLGGLLNTGLGLAGSYLSAGDQLKHQKELQQEAFKYNTQMWNKQNAYNTPAQQMQRYEEAGLNPMLIYGNGVSSAGNASSAPSYEPPHYKGIDMNSVMAFQSMANMMQQNELLAQQTELAKIQAIAASLNASFIPEVKETEINNVKANTKKLEAEADTTSKGDNNSVLTLGFWRKGISNLFDVVGDFIRNEQKKSGSSYPAFERYKKKRGL